MSESHEAQLFVLTDAERESLERPGLRQRSKALVAVTELATKIGLSGDTHAVLMERIRSLDKEDAKLAWETLGDMNELLDMLSVDLRIPSEGEVPLRPVSAEVVPEVDQTVVPEDEVAAEPIPQSVRQPQTLVERVESSTLQEALDKLILGEGEDRNYVIERVESVLEQLRRGGVVLDITAEDFTHETLKQLALIYSEATKADPDMAKVHIACTWGWLSGVEMADLRIWRSSTKPDAKPQDVHNSRASFVNGIIKGWKHGMRPTLDDTDELHEANERLHLVTAEDLPADEVFNEKASEESEATHEREIEEEPKHIQVAKAYIEKLQLTVNSRAFEELLNPQTKGEYTPAKVTVVETLRNRVGNISTDGGIINELDISPRAKAALRRMLGMGFVKHGKPEERHPEPLKDQLRNMNSPDHRGYANDLYTALFALLEQLPEPEQEAAKPLQVVFADDGEARLA